VLAVADAPHSVALVDADSGARLRRWPAPSHAFALSWSADGGRLLVVGTHGARLSTAGGRLVWQRTAVAGTRFVEGRLAPSGRQAAILRAGRSGRTVALLAGGAARTRRLAAGRGLGDLAFSPDGHWLLVGWRRYDSWLFFATAPGDARVRQVTGVSHRVGGRVATVEGWCCVRP
jgi:dipeptidyl aminopeptidase/acylaminoacyl peptidase